MAQRENEQKVRGKWWTAPVSDLGGDGWDLNTADGPQANIQYDVRSPKRSPRSDAKPTAHLEVCRVIPSPCLEMNPPIRRKTILDFGVELPTRSTVWCSVLVLSAI